MKKTLIALTASTLLALSACSSDAEESSTETTAADGGVVTLTVGVSPVPHGEILQYVQDNLAADAGLNIEIVEFSDYVLPNKNLDEGNLDANYFQHVPYFDAQVDEFGYTFEHGDGVHIEPFGLYSKQVESASELADGANIAIVNDPSNQARALWLLEKEGVITLTEGVESPTIFDIAENPKNVEFTEVEAPNLVRALDDADAAVINGNYALEGGLVPTKDAIAIESGKDNPYGNILAWKTDSEKLDAIKKLDELLHSPEVADYITQTWPDGEVIPAF